MRGRFAHIFGLSMVIVYVTLGLLLLFCEVPLTISRNSRIAIGAVLVVYGIVRGYTRYKKQQREAAEEDDTLDTND